MPYITRSQLHGCFLDQLLPASPTSFSRLRHFIFFLLRAQYSIWGIFKFIVYRQRQPAAISYAHQMRKLPRPRGLGLDSGATSGLAVPWPGPLVRSIECLFELNFEVEYASFLCYLYVCIMEQPPPATRTELSSSNSPHLSLRHSSVEPNEIRKRKASKFSQPKKNKI